MATPVGFPLFDADNHYYEATDAFTRYVPRDMQKRCMQWAVIDGKMRLVVGGKINRFIPNPTFDPVSKPGALDAYFRGKVGVSDIRQAFGELEPIPAEYRDRDARLALMDAQGIEGAILFPTLAVGMEQALRDDPDALLCAFEAFNRWLDDDWGYAYRNRLFGAPVMSLTDPDRAVSELEHVLDRGAQVLCMRLAPVPLGGGRSRSPGDPAYDPYWARVAEAGVTVAFHSGDSGYGDFIDRWEHTSDMEAFRFTPLRTLMMSDRAPYDTIAALICHGVFARFPAVRVAVIESGSEWVPLLARKLKKAYAQQPWAFTEDPRETLRRHVWVAPFYEEDIRALADVIGIDHVLFGSDFPHAEGLADPSSFFAELRGFSPDEVRMIMRENALDLVKPRATASV